MGRLDEYSEEEKAAILGCETFDAEQFWADAQLGKRVREMILSGRSGDDLHKLVADVIREAADGR